MRPTRLLLPALLALVTAACSSQEPAYYVTDAGTGRPVAAAQQQSAARSQRGLFSSGSPRAGGAYAYAAPQRGTGDGGRGLFNSDVFGSGLFKRGSSAPAYRYRPQPQAPQTYSYRPPQQQAAPQPSGTMQYQPPQPARQTYARQQYRPAQQPPAGYYAERYRWY